jgi:dUTP pyrophosphatase
MSNCELKFGLSGDAVLPFKERIGDAGYNLCSIESYTLKPFERKLFKTGLTVQYIPEGYELQIRPRSGLALKHGITVLNTPGTVDSGYRSEIGIILINLGTEPYHVNTGDKIAQMVIGSILLDSTTTLTGVSENTGWTYTSEQSTIDREEGGFNSTGY